MARKSKSSRFGRYIRDVSVHTPFFEMIGLLVGLWLVFSTAIYFLDRGAAGTHLHSLGDALYWGIAAFSTAGIADAPETGGAKLVGGIWIVIGSILFFGAIVAAVTGYFTRPLQRPAHRIIETIELNLEQLDDLTLEELDLLKETVDTLIEHVEKIKSKS